METQIHDAMATAVRVPQGLAGPFEKFPLPVWDVEHLRLAIAAAGVALWSWNVDTNRLTMDERAFELWGVPLSAYVGFDDLSVHIHPADRDRVKAAFAATRAIVGPYEIDFRIMLGDECDGYRLAARETMPTLSVASCTESSSTLPDASRPRKATNCLRVK
jgi:PAS domain-containing protein